MRLTPGEIKHLINAAAEFIGENPAELRLFGSRVDDRQKGGDIDLLWLVFDIAIKNQLNAQKHVILARMKELLGDQKIDLKIAEINEVDIDPFLKIIYPKSLTLKIWP